MEVTAEFEVAGQKSAPWVECRVKVTPPQSVVWWMIVAARSGIVLSGANDGERTFMVDRKDVVNTGEKLKAAFERATAELDEGQRRVRENEAALAAALAALNGTKK